MKHLQTALVAFFTAIIVLAGASSIFPVATNPVIQKTKVGSLAEIPSPFFCVNNVCRFVARPSMTAATTTICAIQAPAATSTLIAASWQITTGTSTAATIDMGTSTDRYSTTTNLVAAKSIGSGAQGYATWSSAGGSADDAIMAPNTWVVVKTAGAGLGGYTYGGNCQATFEQI